MLLERVGELLGLELLEGLDDALTRVARFNNVINIAAVSCLIRARELVFVFCFFLSDEGLALCRILDSLNSYKVENAYKDLYTH